MGNGPKHLPNSNLGLLVAVLSVYKASYLFGKSGNFVDGFSLCRAQVCISYYLRNSSPLSEKGEIPTDLGFNICALYPRCQNSYGEVVEIRDLSHSLGVSIVMVMVILLQFYIWLHILFNPTKNI